MVSQYFIFWQLVAIAVSSVIAAVPEDDGRIVNGMAINISQAPYTVRLLTANTLCGGSLIAPNYVVTAAHCIHERDASTLTVIANTTTVYERGIRRGVVRMQIHPEYTKKTRYSDIAVLQLDEPIDNIKTIPLCTQRLKENDIIQVSGWGSSVKKGAGSTQLQTVFLPVRSKAVCDKEYGIFAKQNMFCASGIKAVSACSGDSGGPAVFNGELCGVVSLSWNCGVVGSAEVYADVFATSAFIHNFMFFNWA